MTSIVDHPDTRSLRLVRSTTTQNTPVTVMAASGSIIFTPPLVSPSEELILTISDKAVRAALAANELGFGVPSRVVLRTTHGIAVRLFRDRAAEVDDLSVFFGPDGSGNLVFARNGREADITVRPDGRTFFVSFFDPATGAVREEIVNSPWAVSGLVHGM